MHLRAIAFISALSAAASPALAGIELGLGPVAGEPASQKEAFSAALKAALAQEIASASASCEIKEAGAAATDVVSTTLTPGADGKLHYVVSAASSAGKTTAQTEGEASLADAAKAAAKAVVDALCKHGDTVGAGPQHLTLKYNDLILDDKICDLSKPFAIKAKGKTAGLTLSFTPEKASGGKWTVSGMAGGVPWSGGGEYAANPSTPVGALVMRGKWSIKTPVGVFPGSGLMKGKLEPLSGPCAG